MKLSSRDIRSLDNISLFMDLLQFIIYKISDFHITDVYRCNKRSNELIITYDDFLYYLQISKIFYFSDRQIKLSSYFSPIELDNDFKCLQKLLADNGVLIEKISDAINDKINHLRLEIPEE